MEIGTHLGVRYGDLKNTEANPLRFANAPVSYLQDMLSQWLQLRDSRGGPSLDSLKSVLIKSDLRATASDLTAQLQP